MSRLNTLLCCACLLGASTLVHAQNQAPAPVSSDALVDPVAARQQAREIVQGDPARWYREDATRQARMRTHQKEIGAALQEARNACKRLAAAERKGCEQEARATYQRDLTEAKAQPD